MCLVRVDIDAGSANRTLVAIQVNLANVARQAQETAVALRAPRVELERLATSIPGLFGRLNREFSRLGSISSSFISGLSNLADISLQFSRFQSSLVATGIPLANTESAITNIANVSSRLGTSLSENIELFRSFSLITSSFLNQTQRATAFEGLSNFFQTLGLSQADQANFTSQLNIISNRGRLDQDVFRNISNLRIPNLTNIISEGLGVTTDQLPGVIRRGEARSEDIIPILTNLPQLATSFEELNSRIIDSFGGQFRAAINDAQNTLFLLGNEVAQSTAPAMRILSSHTRATITALGRFAADLLSSDDFQTAIQGFTNGISRLLSGTTNFVNDFNNNLDQLTGASGYVIRAFRDVAVAAAQAAGNIAGPTAVINPAGAAAAREAERFTRTPATEFDPVSRQAALATILRGNEANLAQISTLTQERETLRGQIAQASTSFLGGTGTVTALQDREGQIGRQISAVSNVSGPTRTALENIVRAEVGRGRAGESLVRGVAGLAAIGTEERDELNRRFQAASRDQRGRVSINLAGLSADAVQAGRNIIAAPGASSVDFSVVQMGVMNLTTSLNNGGQNVGAATRTFSSNLTNTSRSTGTLNRAFDNLRQSLSRIDFNRFISSPEASGNRILESAVRETRGLLSPLFTDFVTGTTRQERARQRAEQQQAGTSEQFGNRAREALYSFLDDVGEEVVNQGVINPVLGVLGNLFGIGTTMMDDDEERRRRQLVITVNNDSNSSLTVRGDEDTLGNVNGGLFDGDIIPGSVPGDLTTNVSNPFTSTNNFESSLFFALF